MVMSRMQQDGDCAGTRRRRPDWNTCGWETLYAGVRWATLYCLAEATYRNAAGHLDRSGIAAIHLCNSAGSAPFHVDPACRMTPFCQAAMWFKNLQIYRLPAKWDMTAERLEEALASATFQSCSSLDLQSQGWISPRENGKLVHAVNQQLLIALGTEKKLLPASVVNQVAKAKALEIEEQQGFKPGRKQMKEIKEQVTDTLLPRAFSITRSTWVWIDPIHGWLVVDAGTAAKADEAIKLLIKGIDKLPLEALHVVQSPVIAMTSWLAPDGVPKGFTIDQDTELRASGEGKATVRYVRHTMEPDDVRRHLASGKQCTRLALTWADRISFVLTESLTLKRVTPLDVINENTDSTSRDDDERFDSDMLLMTGELAKLLDDLVFALGGQLQRK